MGWQDRDWAKLNASEFDAIYGSRAAIPPARSLPQGVRRGAWPAIVVSLLAAVTLGPLHILRLPAVSASTPTVYGQPLEDGSICTHLKLVPGAEWKCVGALVPPQDATEKVHVVVPPTYEGACSEVVADQQTGQWLCVSTATSEPTPPS